MDGQVIFKMGNSIRTRLLALLLVLTSVAVAVTGYLGTDSITRAGRRAQEASSETLRAQAENYLLDIVTGAAGQYDLILDGVRADAQNVARYAASIFERADVFTAAGLWRAEDNMFVGPAGQYINGDDDVSSVFVPNSVTVDDVLNRNLELTAYLDLVFAPVYDSDPNTVAIYFLSKHEFTRLYPNLNLGALLPADFLATKDVFYTIGAPENNPGREVAWTPVYEDPAGQGLLITAVAPVYTQDEFLGIIGIDVSLAGLSARIEESSLLPGASGGGVLQEAGGYLFLMNDQGQALAMTEQGYRDVLGHPPQPGELGVDLTTTTTGFAPLLPRVMNEETGFASVQAEDALFAAYAPLHSTGWGLVAVVKAEQMLQAATMLEQHVAASTRMLVVGRVLPIGALILAVAVVVGVLLTNRIIHPLQSLARAAAQIGAGEWDAPLPHTGDEEIDLLSDAIDVMRTQVHEAVEDLERRVAQRTGGLQTVAEVSGAAAMVLDPAVLLRQTVELVQERFGLYYVGLFLLDEERRFAVLRAGTGEAGAQMLERGHRLEVGSNSMIGRCAATGKADVQLDVGEAAVRFNNPLLPKTRSELALPLRSRGRTIGAMTVQSDQEAAFDEESVALLQTLADQVGVAIDNAQLYTSAQAALAEMQLAQQRYMGHAWATYLQQGVVDSYDTQISDEHPRVPLEQEDLENEIAQALQAAQVTSLAGKDHAALVAPVSVRGQLVGMLGIQDEDAGRQWTEEDLALVTAVVERMAIVADGLRLLDETQQREANERLIREITNKMRRAADMDALIRITVQEMAAVLSTRAGPSRGPDVHQVTSDGAGAFLQLSTPGLGMSE